MHNTQWAKYLRNLKTKRHKFLNACYSMKEGASKKNYGSTVIPKA